MDVTLIVRHIYPHSEPLRDFEVSDTGSGPYISVWRLADPQPTQAELEAAWPEAKKQIDIARIAATRYEHEVRGITHDTRYIATDRTSQSKLHAARTKGLEGIAPAAGWKCADANGNIVWWDCTAAEIVEAANAAFDYVDACFVREKELALSVADGTFTEADLETGWPA